MTGKAPLDRAAWWLLCALVFSVPWEKSLWVPGVGTATRLVGLLALLAGVFAAIVRRRVRPPNLALVLAGMFVVWSAATRIWSCAPAATSARAWTFAQLVAMVWLVWEFCREPEQPPQLMAAYVWGAVLASAGTIVRYAQNQQTYYRRYAAAGFDPNDLALTVALAIPLCFYLALRGRAWVYRCVVPLLLSAILLAASRAALVAAFLAFAFVVLTWRQSSRAQRLSAIVLLALLILGTVGLAPAASRQRLATLPGELTQGTLHNRTRIWKIGLKVLKHRPVRGVGSGAYAEAVRPWLGTPAIPGHEYVAHNTFLSVLVESGAVGLAIFGACGAVLIVFVWMLRTPERALWLVMLAVWTAGVLTLTWEHRKPTWLLMALIMTQWVFAFRPDAREGGES